MIEGWKPEGDDIDFKCPGADCRYRALVDKNMFEIECPLCSLKSCPKCLDKSHKEVTCENYRKWKE